MMMPPRISQKIFPIEFISFDCFVKDKKKSYNNESRLFRQLPGAMLQASDAVYRQFKDEPDGHQLPFPVMRPDEFFPAIPTSPVGTYPNDFGTHALHEDANEDKANVFHK